MSNLDFYKRFFELSNEDDLVNLFQQEILKTNRDYSFFVDWKKVQTNLLGYKVKLNLLNSLIGSTNFYGEFKSLLEDYPEVIQVFPILAAIRNLELQIINESDTKIIKFDLYNFNVKKDHKLTSAEIEKYYYFIEKMGIVHLFSNIHNFYDYVFGVEVGMDTNARKNRGGKAMERIMSPLIEKICNKYSIDFLKEEKMGKIGKRYGIIIPKEYENRICDFLLIKKKKLVNIEVNFYSGPGSKPEEIVNSYIQRKNSLEKENIGFIWITDGDVWNTSTNQLSAAFRSQKYVLNLSFVKKGLLEEAIKEIFELK